MRLPNCLDIGNLIGSLFRKQKEEKQEEKEVRALTFGPTARTITTSVLDLMDFPEYEIQYLSFQNTLINYIFDKSSIITSQKLSKCCKYFKLLHQKRNENEIEVLERYDCVSYVAAGLVRKRIENRNFPTFFCRFPFIYCKNNLKNVTKSVKILNAFVLWQSCHFDCFILIIEKLDLSQTKKIDIMVPFLLEQDILESLLNPFLKEFILSCHSNENVNPALLVFQRCPKIKKLSLYFKNDDSPIPMINEKILKEIIITKRENRIEEVIFKPVTQIDQEDFLVFLDNQMADDSVIVFKIESEEAFDELNQMLERIERITQKNENDGIRVFLYWGQSRDLYYL